jgi:hypothetical protein
MTIRIESISFNHRPLTPATGALTIRKNQSEDVTVPEWQNGMTDPARSPAAYTIDQIRGNALTIKVEFTRTSAGDPANVVVRAVAQTGNVFGDIVSQTINFGTALSTFAFFTLTSVLRNPAVGIRDVAWDWFADGTLLQTTRHRIYSLAGAPQPPWGQPGSRFTDFQVPWTDVLDHACLQATGAQTVDEAADRLTRWVNSLGAETTLQYDEQGGASHFTLNGMTTFNCTEFLRVLARGPGARAKVNCTDCATIVSSFANILGCNLVQSRIGFEFQTNLIQKIGLVYPYKQPFKFHEVAWKFPSSGDAFVYDPCLLFDGDSNVAEQPFQATLGVAKPLGTPATDGYFSRVIAPTRGTAPSERLRTRVQRKIDGRMATRTPTDPVQMRLLAEEYNFSSWQGTPPPDVAPPCKCHCEEQAAQGQDQAPDVLAKQRATSDQQLLLLNYSVSQDGFAPSGWKLDEVRQFDAEPDPFKLTDAIWSATECSKAKLRVTTYECSSIPAARSFLLSLLGEFDKPGIKRRQKFIIDRETVEIGDVAFADLDELVLVFARVNIVVLIQNAARQVVPVPQFAFELDADITRGPDLKGKKPQEVPQFGIPEKKIRVGDEIPMQCHSGSPKNGNGTQFSFLGNSGQMFLKGNDLLYRPLAGGEQVLTILGHHAGQEIVRQELKLSVEQPLAVQETPCKKLENPNKEEDSVMPDVKGSWSSIRPTSDGGPTDLSQEGFIIIEDLTEAGEIRGCYVDTVNQTVETVTGYVNDSRPEPYRLVLRHSVGEGITREYDGRLRGIDEGEVQVVVGRYTDIRDPEPATDASVLASQEGGIWVATKP